MVLSKEGTYAVDPVRVTKATEVFQRCVREMEAEDVAGVLMEIGLGNCAEFVWNNDAMSEQLAIRLTDLQTVAAAAALASAMDGLQNAPIEVKME